MSNNFNLELNQNEPFVYQIRIIGHLGTQWGEWFGGMSVAPQENGDTILTGPVTDQAALFGLLKKVRDLGVPLVSLVRLQPSLGDDKCIH